MDEINHSTQGLPFVPKALDELGLDPYAFRVYAHACRRAGAGSLFYGGGSKVARICGMGLRRVRQALAKLKRMGLLEVVEESSGRPTTYRVHPCTTCTGAPHAPVAVEAPVHDVHGTGAPGAHPPVHQVHTEVTPLKLLPEGTPLGGMAPPRGGWPAKLAATWRGFGEVGEGHLGKALAAVVKTHGPERTEAGLRRWLEAGNARFGVECFARDAVSWIKDNGSAQSRRGLSRADRIDAKVSAGQRRAQEADRIREALGKKPE